MTLTWGSDKSGKDQKSSGGEAGHRLQRTRNLTSRAALLIALTAVSFVPFFVSEDAFVAAKMSNLNSQFDAAVVRCNYARQVVAGNPGKDTIAPLCQSGIGSVARSDNPNVAAEVRRMNDALRELNELADRKAHARDDVRTQIATARLALDGAIGSLLFVVSALLQIFGHRRPKSPLLPDYPTGFAAGHIVVGAALGVIVSFLVGNVDLLQLTTQTHGIAMAAGFAGSEAIQLIKGKISGL